MRPSTIIKHSALVALILLGFVEMLFPMDIALKIYSFGPQFRQAFDAAKLTEEQRLLYLKFLASLRANSQIVFYFGVATVALAVLILVAEKFADKKKPAAV